MAGWAGGIAELLSSTDGLSVQLIPVEDGLKDGAHLDKGRVFRRLQHNGLVSSLIECFSHAYQLRIKPVWATLDR